MSKTVKFLFILAVFFSIALGFYLTRTAPFSSNPNSASSADSGSSRNSATSSSSDSNTAPTSFPFQELTIPYLTSRDYKSRLKNTRLVSQNSNYNSYLASYDSDGLTLNGLLTRPTGEQPAGGWPAIIFIHGYIPPAQYQTQEKYASYVDYLARNNFVVFKIDLRGHADSEGTASGAYFSGDYIIDTLNARSALASSSFVNADRIGLWGHSMAGNVILRSVAASQDIPAAVIWAGAVYTYEDMRQFGIDDNSYRRPSADSTRRQERERLNQTHGDFDPDSQFWQMVPATNYLDQITAAIQIHHAVNDPVVTIDYSRNLERIVRNTDINFELIEYPAGGHNLAGSTFTQAMQNTVEFFKNTL